MKLYVFLLTEPYETYQQFCGVFTSKEKALEALEALDEYPDELVEVEVDNPEHWRRVWPEDGGHWPVSS